MSILLGLLLALSPVADDKSDADAPKGDLKTIQGKWTTKIGPNKDMTLTMEFKGKDIVVLYPTEGGDLLTLRGEVKLNESTKMKTVDFVKFKNNGEPMDDSLGLYKIEDEKFILCVGMPGEDRPVEFKAGEESPRLWTFARVK